VSVGPELEDRELSATSGPAVRWPSVTVIVPVHGDRGELAATTRALAAQDYPGAVDVVVVDNGDNEGLEASVGVLPSVQLLRAA
jgi:GT2 family glycosyltransferase